MFVPGSPEPPDGFAGGARGADRSPASPPLRAPARRPTGGVPPAPGLSAPRRTLPSGRRTVRRRIPRIEATGTGGPLWLSGRVATSPPPGPHDGSPSPAPRSGGAARHRHSHAPKTVPHPADPGGSYSHGRTPGAPVEVRRTMGAREIRSPLRDARLSADGQKGDLERPKERRVRSFPGVGLHAGIPLRAPVPPSGLPRRSPGGSGTASLAWGGGR